MYNLTLNRMSELMEGVAKQTEASILAQLNEFIRRDIIVIELGPMSLVQEPDKMSIAIRQKVSLKLKDRELIERLEKDNAEMREQLKVLLGLKSRLGAPNET